MGWFRNWIDRTKDTPMLRPWALIAPVLVLLVATPMLRPLHHPAQPSNREWLIIESVQSILQRGTLRLDPKRVQNVTGTIKVGDSYFSEEPPVFPIVLAGVGWVIERTGVTFEKNRPLMEFLLTLFAITVPVAMASGMVYRMARVFELKRYWRVTIAILSVMGTGWISYSVVLLPHALAASLVVFAMSSILQVSSARKPSMNVGWLFLGGICAATASAIEVGAIWFLCLIPFLIATLRLPARVRIIGILLFIAGAAPLITLHISINTQITGDILPPRWHVQFTGMSDAPTTNSSSMQPDDIETVDPSVWLSIGRGLNRTILFSFGQHGLFSHFPLLLIALGSAIALMHRHWTRWMKIFAGGTALSVVVMLIVKSIMRPDDVDSSYAATRLVVFAPMLMFFIGAVMRKRRRAFTWVVLGILTAYSVFASIVGTVNPDPPAGYNLYTAGEALAQWLQPAHKEE